MELRRNFSVNTLCTSFFDIEKILYSVGAHLVPTTQNAPSIEDGLCYNQDGIHECRVIVDAQGQFEFLISHLF